MDEQALEPRHRVILREKGNMRGADYSAAVDYLHAFGRRMAALMTQFDVILTPTMAQPPARIGALTVSDDQSLSDFIDTFHGFSPFTALFNASGQPAMSVPLHWNAEGLRSAPISQPPLRRASALCPCCGPGTRGALGRASAARFRILTTLTQIGQRR